MLPDLANAGSTSVQSSRCLLWLAGHARLAFLSPLRPTEHSTYRVNTVQKVRGLPPGASDDWALLRPNRENSGAINRFQPSWGRLRNYSRATRRGGSQSILPSCLSFYTNKKPRQSRLLPGLKRRNTDWSACM